MAKFIIEVRTKGFAVAKADLKEAKTRVVSLPEKQTAQQTHLRYLEEKFPS